nr:putative peptidoglycan glycosyltransferase FtsW [Canibacter zhuwentaonis]
MRARCSSFWGCQVSSKLTGARIDATVAAVSGIKKRPLNRGIIAIWAVAVPLMMLGALMVTSASATQAEGAFASGARHFLYALVAIVLMGLVAMFVTITLLRKIAPWFALLAVILQLLVLFSPLGVTIGGNRNWLALGPVTVQPSEFLKLALIILLSLSIYQSHRNKTVVQNNAPIWIVSFALIIMIVIGHDQGTASVLGLIVIGCLYFTGASGKRVASFIGVGAAAAVLGVLTSSNRLDRIKSLFITDNSVDYATLNWQPTHAIWAIANGGVNGTGIGNSIVKWAWLPASENDYIFAIIAEELGLIGAICVLLGYGVLAWALIWILGTVRDNFSRGIIGGVLVWIIGQAIVNIAVVLRILPVLGVPLPLISAGGSALLACALALGVVLVCAHEAETRIRKERLPTQKVGDASLPKLNKRGVV